ncbi:MAG: anaerobic sulfatase maturase [Armatimonadetes bacterium]|nr:anaerobic sulfatase maturase [Armatimonadota bacterium]
MPQSFHVMLKPRGAICNLDCSYCFYLRKEALFERDSSFKMSDEVLESFTRQYIEAQSVPEVTFAWQGGEPTLMGIEFFEKALECQRKYARPGMTIHNAFQTNGTLIDDEWCTFLRDNRFLVGLSLDGPRELHDANRVDKGGHPTFDRVYATLKRFQRYGIEHNVLCVVNSVNCHKPLEVYRFFRDERVQFMQFIPAVEQLPDGAVTDWTVPAEHWGRFLCGVFDEWVRKDVGRIFVQHFDMSLQAWMGMEPSLCVHAKTCGNALAMEHSGDLFSCDHFVRPEYYLGNIMRTPMKQMAASPFQRKFGQDKLDTLPRQCRECEVRFVCNGGCPKDRFITTADGEEGLNYLCAGYRMFFNHINGPMRTMARLLREQKPPAMIMDILAGRNPSNGTGAPAQIGRNSPCPCGSGLKYKRCCGKS